MSNDVKFKFNVASNQLLAGQLKETIIFQNVTKTTDEYGGTTFSYEDAIRTKAKVTYKGGNRLDSNNEIHYYYSIEFTIRGYHQVNEDMVVLYKGKRYRILSIDYTIREQKKIITELIND